MSETIIKVDHVSKQYRLGTIGGGTLKGDLQSAWARWRGREDPNEQIGQAARGGNARFLALDDVSFEVKKGEALGIIGHNGAGKSTLLKLLSRVTAPTKGTICYNGRIASMLEVGTGFHPELTGRENVYLNGAILGMTKTEIDRKFDQIVSFAEMEQFIDTPVKRYSSGMYVKLAFAVAAHLDSEILVMDEVLAVGDMKFQQKCLGRMGDAANQEGRTVLYVSHNMNTIRQLCTRCIVLDHGRVAFDGAVEKAVGVYMNKYDCSILNSYDLRTLTRPSFIQPNYVQMRRFEYRYQEVSSDNFTRIGFSLSLDYIKEIRDLNLRVIIYAQDGTPVGMASTESGQMSDVIRTGVFNARLKNLPLVSGTYYLKLALYNVNDFGSETIYDVIDKTVFFKVESCHVVNNLNWSQQWWGHVWLENIKKE